MVRLALVTSVTCTPPSVPPVSCQITQLSVVPKMASPFSAASRTPSTFSRIHWIFPPAKYGCRRQAGLVRLMTSPRPSRSSAVAMRSVRVSCHTMAL